MPMARAHSLLDAADLFPARAPCLPLSPMPPGLLPFALSTPAAPPAVCPILLPLPSRVPPVPPDLVPQARVATPVVPPSPLATAQSPLPICAPLPGAPVVRVLPSPAVDTFPLPVPISCAQPLLNAAGQLSAPTLALGLCSHAPCAAACLICPVGPISVARVDAACHTSHLAFAPLLPADSVMPPCDPSLPEADPAPTLTACIAVLAASPSAVLKAAIGIRECRRRMRQIWRRVFQVF